MSFDRNEVANLLVKCHRRCCICHRFCGSKMEIDHIIQKADGGSDEISNGIAVCFDCHAEIHHYNTRHPKGRKFTPEEIRGHKNQWLNDCKTKPEIFAQSVEADVGCLGALIDELGFNEHIANNPRGMLYCQFKEHQFLKSINAGVLSILPDEVRQPIFEVYQSIGKIKQGLLIQSNDPIQRSTTVLGLVRDEIKKSKNLISEAKDKLLEFLQSDKENNELSSPRKR